MAFIPANWNIVVLGKWNRAIFTPSRVSQDLFGLSETDPVEVMVPLDVLGPYQIKHEKLVLIPDDERLTIVALECDFETLEKALVISSAAVTGLPKTPLTAAGINVRYTVDADMGRLGKLVQDDSDNDLSDERFEILARSHRRTLKWNDGRLNIWIDQKEDYSFDLLFNFDLSSTDVNALSQWLSPSVQVIEQTVKTLFEKYLQISYSDNNNATTPK